MGALSALVISFAPRQWRANQASPDAQCVRIVALAHGFLFRVFSYYCHKP